MADIKNGTVTITGLDAFEKKIKQLETTNPGFEKRLRSVIREVLGNASFAGIAIPFLEPYKIEFLVKAPGGMMVYGLLIALVYVVTHGKAPLKSSFSCAGCPAAERCRTGACQRKGDEA
jgi:hypothetical protein